MSKILGVIAVPALWIAMLWVEVGGTVHAFTRHGTGDGFAAVFVPPWALYRSVEFFWHKEEDGDDRSPRVTKSSSRADSIREILVLTSTAQENLTKMMRGGDDASDRLEMVILDLDQIAGASRETMNWAYSGWGDAVLDQWVPGVRALTTLATQSAPGLNNAEGLAEVRGRFALYDQWLVSNRDAMSAELKRKKIIDAYTDSANRVH